MAKLELKNLDEELWLAVLDRVSDQDVVRNCHLVSRRWRALAQERTSKRVILEDSHKCLTCGNRNWEQRENELKFASFLSYLHRRTATLQVLVFCPATLPEDDWRRLSEVLQHCSQLKYLEVATRDGGHLSAAFVDLLPSSLESLHAGFDSLRSLEALTRLTSLSELYVCDRHEEEDPLLHLKLDAEHMRICQLTSLQRLSMVLHNAVPLVPELRQLQQMRQLALTGLQQLTHWEVDCMLGLPHLQKLALRDVDCMTMAATGLAGHPSLQELWLHGQVESLRVMPAVLSIPQLTEFSCTSDALPDEEYLSTDPVAVPGVSLERSKLRYLCLALDLSLLLDLPAVLKAPQLSSLEIHCQRLSLVNLPPRAADGLMGSLERSIDVSLAAGLQMSRYNRGKLERAGFQVTKKDHIVYPNNPLCGGLWIATFPSPDHG